MEEQVLTSNSMGCKAGCPKNSQECHQEKPASRLFVGSLLVKHSSLLLDKLLVRSYGPFVSGKGWKAASSQAEKALVIARKTGAQERTVEELKTQLREMHAQVGEILASWRARELPFNTCSRLGPPCTACHAHLTVHEVIHTMDLARNTCEMERVGMDIKA
eukprot:1158443-Pelagomonas_calceolata.AAC.16